MDVVVSCPEGYEPVKEIEEQTLQLAKLNGGSYTLHYDPVEAVAGANIVYTDVWASMGLQAPSSLVKRRNLIIPGRRGAWP